MKFKDLDLKPEILNGLDAMGYTDLTPIQEQTLKPILDGRDLIARAETGSGKTSACAIPVLQRTDPEQREVQALVVVPTRELALQYVQEIADVARFTKIAPFAVYGGFDMSIQLSKLAHGVHILVATPGRLIDLLRRSDLTLRHVNTVVLDEADEMLDMGFFDDIDFIMSCLIHEHQTLLFSATMPGPIKKLASRYLNDPLTVELNLDQAQPQSLKHVFALVNQNSHFDTFIRYLKDENPAQAIIFCRSRRNVEQVYKRLSHEFDSVACIHGGLEQGKRTSLFNRFRAAKVQFMVATDVASRGLDFSQVSHVINYDFPTSLEAYTHRTGRTARMGRTGTAITFLGRSDLRNVKSIIRQLRVEAHWLGESPDLENVSGRSRSGTAGVRGGRGGGQSGQSRRRGGQRRRSSSKGKPSNQSPPTS